MPSSKKWAQDAAEVLTAEIGQNKALLVIRALRRVPGANKSVDQTLSMLYDAVYFIEAQ